MRRIRMIIQYDGTNYVGWQVQPNGLAVQQVIEQELKKLTGETIRLHASGRTDSGVHALAQVAHFDTCSRIPGDKFAYALNAGLPADIRIQYSENAPNDFHARFSAKSKQYRYTILNAPHAQVFCRNTALHIHGKLDVEAMDRVAKAVIGEHDFCAFMASSPERVIENTVRTVFKSEWSQSGSLLHYDIEGNGFLYNMVRILVGTMLEIGMGRKAEESIIKALNSKKRKDAGSTAPAHGLMLVRVRYSDFDTAQICQNID